MTDAAAPEADLESEADQAGIRMRGAVVKQARTVLFSRPAIGVLTLLSLAVAVELAPGLDRFRLLGPRPSDSAPVAAVASPALELGEARIESETLARPELAQPEESAGVEGPSQKRDRGPIARATQTELPRLELNRPPVSIVDPEQRALLGFYRALYRTELKQAGAVTRIVQFGDSIIVSDYVSGTLRRKFQTQFGDAGHGFVLAANAWPGYFHNDVYRFASSGWLVSRVVGPLNSDGWYGLGGVSFRAPPGSRARFGTARTGRFGRAVSRFVVSYVEEPGGGQMKLNLDGKPWGTIDAAAEQKRAKTQEVTAPDGEHELEIVTARGMSRVFGVTMERDVPGVVLDAIGIQGARVRFLDKQDDAHWAEQLRSRKPDLLVYQFGANESGDGFAYPMAEYKRTMQEVLRQGRTAVPEAGCLVISAIDRAEKRGTALISMEVIPAIVKEQRRAALEVGCAFFDTYAAMGGRGSMPTWVARGLGQADLTHPTGSGSEVLAKWIYRALLEGYETHRQSRAAAGGERPAQ